MLKGVAWLLGFQAIGELASSLLRLPVSGAVCGMALLLGWLIHSGEVPQDLQRVTDGLLANMPILFVPVGAGAVAYLELFQRQWLIVVIGVVAGTFFTLGATALVVRFLMGRSLAPEARATPVDEFQIRNRS